jgi:hypothetical protein
LVALGPDVILADTTQTVAALRSATRTIPIVFASAIDPVGGGFVESLARPGGNTTGMIAAKWLALLKEIAPQVTRAAVLRDPTVSSGIGQFAAIQAVAPVGMELSVITIHDDLDAVERAVEAVYISAIDRDIRLGPLVEPLELSFCLRLRHLLSPRSKAAACGEGVDHLGMLLRPGSWDVLDDAAFTGGR